MDTPLNDLPRRKLREIVASYGRDIHNDSLRCKALLLDVCGEYKREVNILVTALDERVPADLLASSAHAPYSVLQARLTKRLYENRGLAEDFARWGVDSWALALGLISESNLSSHQYTPTSPTGHTPADSNKITLPPPYTSPRPIQTAPVFASRQSSAPKKQQPMNMAPAGNAVTPRPPGTNRRTMVIGCASVAIVVLVLGITLVVLPLRNSIALTNGYATATANSADATATNTDPYGSYSKLVLDDPLIDNSRGYGWNDPDCQFTNGTYSTSVSVQQRLTLCVASQTSFSNFAYQLQIRIVTGDKGCIIFHENSNQGQAGHAFCIGNDGSYVFLSMHNDNGTQYYDITKQGNSSAVIQGQNQINTLGVLVQDTQITFYVNKVQALTASDTASISGAIGVGALDVNSTTKVVFSDARVWTD